MDQRPVPPPPLVSPALVSWLRRPQFFLPLAVVAGMTIVAFAVQPGGARGESPASVRTATIAASATTPAATATTPASTATALAKASATPSVQPGATLAAQIQGQAPGSAASAQPTAQPTSDVAGVRATPPDTPTQAAPDLSRQANQCGSLQETTIPLAIEQAINGVSVRATRATIYPIEYFRCMLMATGTQDAFSLASTVAKAESAGMTHAVLVDLWITNAGKDFAQLTLKDSQLAAAGQVFNPLATIGGRADVVVSSGQGRNVTLVVGIKNKVGATTGPLTLTIGAPLFGGQPTAGKFSLFLPTP